MTCEINNQVEGLNSKITQTESLLTSEITQTESSLTCKMYFDLKKKPRRTVKSRYQHIAKENKNKWNPHIQQALARETAKIGVSNPIVT